MKRGHWGGRRHGRELIAAFRKILQVRARTVCTPRPCCALVALRSRLCALSCALSAVRSGLFALGCAPRFCARGYRLVAMRSQLCTRSRPPSTTHACCRSRRLPAVSSTAHQIPRSVAWQKRRSCSSHHPSNTFRSASSYSTTRSKRARLRCVFAPFLSAPEVGARAECLHVIKHLHAAVFLYARAACIGCHCTRGDDQGPTDHG